MRGRKPVSHAAKGTVFLRAFAAFNCIMNHSTSKILHILDAFLDFFLLLGAYEVSSLLRMHSTWGEAFWWVDVARFRPLSLVYAAAIILIYIAQGEYRTFKRRGLVRELAKALLGNLRLYVGSNHFVCIPTFAVFPPAACLLLPAVQRGHYDQAVIAAPDQPLVCKAAPYYSPRFAGRQWKPGVTLL